VSNVGPTNPASRENITKNVVRKKNREVVLLTYSQDMVRESKKKKKKERKLTFGGIHETAEFG